MNSSRNIDNTKKQESKENEPREVYKIKLNKSNFIKQIKMLNEEKRKLAPKESKLVNYQIKYKKSKCNFKEGDISVQKARRKIEIRERCSNPSTRNSSLINLNRSHASQFSLKFGPLLNKDNRINGLNVEDIKSHMKKTSFANRSIRIPKIFANQSIQESCHDSSCIKVEDIIKRNRFVDVCTENRSKSVIHNCISIAKVSSKPQRFLCFG